MGAFVVGSFLYRPVFPACPSLSVRYAGSAQVGEETAERVCESTGDFGTRLYIAGSVMYLTEALLAFVCCALKGQFQIDDNKVGNKAVDDEELMVGSEED